jgi:hypothetical protein
LNKHNSQTHEKFLATADHEQFEILTRGTKVGGEGEGE